MSGLWLIAIDLQLGERQRRLAGRGDRFGHGGDDVQVGKEGFDRAARSAGVAPGWIGGKRNGGARCPGSRWGFPVAQRYAAAEPVPGLRRPRAGRHPLARAGCRPVGTASWAAGRGPIEIPATIRDGVGEYVSGKQGLPAVLALARDRTRESSWRRFPRSQARAAGLRPSGSRPGIPHGCQPGTVCHNNNRPCTHTIARQEQYSVRWSPLHGKPSKASYRLKLKLMSYGLYRAWQT